MKLTLKQTQAIDCLEDPEVSEAFYGGAAGGGKTRLGVYWLAKQALKYPRTRWLMGRAELKTLKRTTLVSFFDMCQEQGLKAGVHYDYNQNESVINMMGGSQILLADLKYYPSDPNFDALGSLEVTGAFVDQSEEIIEKAKQIVLTRIRYRLQELGLRPKFLHSANPAKNWLYTNIYKPWKEGKLPNDVRFIPALVTDNPYLTPEYIANLHKLDKVTKARLLRGEWEYEDDPAQLMMYDNIVNIFTNSFVKPTGKRYITADVARLGDDKTIIRVWDGFRVIHRFVLEKKRTTEVIAAIKKVADDYSIPRSQIVIDEDGIGGGVVDHLPGCNGFIANSRPINPKAGEDYENLKSQCAFLLAAKVNNNEIYEECDTSDIKTLITEDLEQIKKKNFGKQGKAGVIPKDEVKAAIGRSPDDGDTYIMRMYFELKKGGLSVATR